MIVVYGASGVAGAAGATGACVGATYGVNMLGGGDADGLWI